MLTWKGKIIFSLFLCINLCFGFLKHQNFLRFSNTNRIFAVSRLLDCDPKANFLVNIVKNDKERNTYGGRVITRFPPEPNGKLHLGHAKSIFLNFGIAKSFGGLMNLRLDDTNPSTESQGNIDDIIEDVKWLLGSQSNNFPWNGKIRYASDYFPTMFECAKYLIEAGDAYVDDSSPDEVRMNRGTLTSSGIDSPFRLRSKEENMIIFQRMYEGLELEGSHVLRAKINNSSPNLCLRDPPLYRIKHVNHPRSGTKWHIYPMYDFAHTLSDLIEGITHSLCTMEFDLHRPLYDWILDHVMPSGIIKPNSNQWRPKQIEFSRLNMGDIVLSKRKLMSAISMGSIESLDDPRLYTLAGLRRRGVPARAIQYFCDLIGVSRAESNISMSLFDECIREVLDNSTLRAFAIADPLAVRLVNWNEGEQQIFEVSNHPRFKDMGTRKLPISHLVYIDRSDFFDTGVNNTIQPPNGYKRLRLGHSVRLKNAFVINCIGVTRDDNGNVTELQVTYDPLTCHGVTPAGQPKVKGIIQWIDHTNFRRIRLRNFVTLSDNASHRMDAEKCDRVCSDCIWKNDAMIESSILEGDKELAYQFERLGYYVKDSKISSDPDCLPIYNRIVPLKDSFL